MKATKTVLLILSAIMVSGLMMSQTSHAEIFKWVDDKGTVLPDKQKPSRSALRDLPNAKLELRGLRKK